MKKLNQTGALDLMLVIALVAVLAVGGFVVWRVSNNDVSMSSKKSNNIAQQNQSSNNNNSNDDTKDANIARLANGKATFNLGEIWKVESTSDDEKACPQNLGYYAKCIESALVLLKNEDNVNSDQFSVEVSLFEKTDELSADDWYTDVVLLGNDANTIEEKKITIQDYDAMKYLSDYSGDNKELRVVYVVVSGDKAVTVRASTFDGKYYSFKNPDNIDYTQYLDEIETLAKSVILN